MRESEPPPDHAPGRDRTTGQRRRELLRLLAAGGVGSLAGCSSAGTENTEQNDEATQTPQTARDSTVTFTHISTFDEPAAALKNELADAPYTLRLQSTPGESVSTQRYLRDQFNRQSDAFDVLMMDVIWPAQFVANDWIAPVADPGGLTEKMLDTPVESVSVDGQLYGIPLYTDANVFYYRKDKLEEYGFEPPDTYSEVIDQAQTILDRDREITKGYIWQGGATEGLTIMWLNWLWGFGGSVWDGDRLVVNSKEAVRALQHAVELIYKFEITPESVPASGTDGNRKTFQQGETLFMRNWPYALAKFEDSTPVTGKVGVTTLPSSVAYPDVNNSCLGGWSLAVNKNAHPAEKAQTFIRDTGSLEIQKLLAIEFSRLPVRKELYSETYYSQQPALETFASALRETSVRPQISQYSTFSEIVYTNCNQALLQEKNPRQALEDAQTEIDATINEQ